MLNVRTLLKVCFVTLFISGCGGDSSSDGDVEPQGEEQYIGLISESEFYATPTPTYEGFYQVFQEVTEEDPSLLDDEDLLSKEIFDRLKSQDRSIGSFSNRDLDSYLDPFNRFLNVLENLTYEEWEVMVRNPVDAAVNYSSVGLAGQSAVDSYPCDSVVGFADGKADALRHAYWNALMTRRSDFDFALEFATAHESASLTEDAKRMDLYNNAVGRRIALQYPSASDSEILEILIQQPYVYIEGMEEIPEGTLGLVYFKNQELLDVQMVGYMTNPDSGGPWDATFNFNQCGSDIRGNMEIVRGDSFQKRWLNGVFDSSSSVLVLGISFPYTENASDYSRACRGVEASFAVNDGSMSGGWTSSNCDLGGVINISK